MKKKTASELDEGEDEATAIVFTRAMTIDGNYPAIPATSPSRQLTLSVADTEGASSAVVLLSDEADGDYPWVTEYSAGGTDNGTLTVVVLQNTTGAERSASFTIRVAGVADPLKATLTQQAP